MIFPVGLFRVCKELIVISWIDRVALQSSDCPVPSCPLASSVPGSTLGAFTGSPKVGSSQGCPSGCSFAAFQPASFPPHHRLLVIVGRVTRVPPLCPQAVLCGPAMYAGPSRSHGIGLRVSAASPGASCARWSWSSALVGGGSAWSRGRFPCLNALWEKPSTHDTAALGANQPPAVRVASCSWRETWPPDRGADSSVLFRGGQGCADGTGEGSAA